MDRNAVKPDIIVKIADIGRRHYVNEIINWDITNKDVLENDWYEALKFFYSKAFYQGRLDSISERFRENAIKALDSYLGQSFEQRGHKLDELQRVGAFEKENWETNQLWNILVNHKVNKRGDRLMVITSLKFLLSLSDWDKNIINWSVHEIKGGNLRKVHETLDSIWSIGDKIASLFIRDLVHIFNLEKILKGQDLLYVQPVDTWVRQVSKKIGLIQENDSDQKLKQITLGKCQEIGISPIEFNEGAWYIGAKSFNIVFELLQE